MPKVYLRKRGDSYIEVDPQIIRWRKLNGTGRISLLNKLTAQQTQKSKLGRPKGTKKPPQFKKFF